MKHPFQISLAERGPLSVFLDLSALISSKISNWAPPPFIQFMVDGFLITCRTRWKCCLFDRHSDGTPVADRDYRFGHWKIEDLASLPSIIMFYVDFDVLRDTIQKFQSWRKRSLTLLKATLRNHFCSDYVSSLSHNNASVRNPTPALRAAARTIFRCFTSLGTLLLPS